MSSTVKNLEVLGHEGMRVHRAADFDGKRDRLHH